jgi:antitoxin component of MazEF toxin-antitoxin module
MIKTITKIGNSQGIIFDSALMELAHLKVGDEMSVTCHDGGSIILTPIRPLIDTEQVAKSAKRIIGKNEELFRRLS